MFRLGGSTRKIGKPVAVACLAAGLTVSGCVPAPPVAMEVALGGLQPVVLAPGTPPTFAWTIPRPRAAVVAVHGLKGSAGVFAEVARRWANQEIETYAVTVEYPQAGAEELLALARQISARRPGTPLFVIGESLGACLVLNAFSRADAPRVDGIILTGPAIWPDAVSAAMAEQGLAFLGLVGGIHAAYWSRIVRIMDQARNHAEAIRIRPILVLRGDLDEVVDRQGVEELVRRLGQGTEFHRFPQGGTPCFAMPGGMPSPIRWHRGCWCGLAPAPRRPR